MKNPFRILLMAAFVGACAPGNPPNQLPTDWYVNPDSPQTIEKNEEPNPTLTEPSPRLEAAVTDLYSTTYDGIDGIRESTSSLLAPFDILPANKPKDWVPWHLGGISAEFGVSIKGMIGPLILKGAPSVTATWIKQYSIEKSAAQPLEARLEPVDAIADETTSTDELMRQLEPAVRAAIATKRVKNAGALRSNLTKAAAEFLETAGAMKAASEGRLEGEDIQWWLSRFRLDLIFDVSGKVTPVFGVGAETRLRLEWHRIMPKPSSVLAESLSPSTRVSSKREKQIFRFVDGMYKSLAGANDEFRAVTAHGFQAHTFRVGVGFTAEGNIGIAKTSAVVAGHIYFTSNVPKPVIHPKPTPLPEAGRRWGAGEGDDQIGMLAGNKLTPFKSENYIKGLKRAVKLGGFFAKKAAASKSGSWRIYEIKAGFDLSLSGTIGLVTVGGVGLTEIAFFNRAFGNTGLEL